jgi:hypothetical protein
VLKILLGEYSEKFSELQIQWIANPMIENLVSYKSNEWKKQWVTNLVIENPIAYESNDWKIYWMKSVHGHLKVYIGH